MSLAQKLNSISITRKANSHWYETDFYASGNLQYGHINFYADLLIRKFRILYTLLHAWSTYTDNSLFSKNHKKRISLQDKIKKEINISCKTQQTLFKLDNYDKKRSLVYIVLADSISNGGSEIIRADKYHAKKILRHAVISLIEIHKKGLYHGDAMLKNLWLGIKDGAETAQWTGFMNNTYRFSLEDKQNLDFLTLMLSHKKYAKNSKEEWWDLARWTITEIRGYASKETAQGVIDMLKRTSEKGIFIARRITPKDRARLIYYMESLQQ